MTCPSYSICCVLPQVNPYYSQHYTYSSKSKYKQRVAFHSIRFLSLHHLIYSLGTSAITVSHDLLIRDVYRSHTTTHDSRYDSSGRWSVRHRDLYLTTQNAHNRQTSMTPVGFETTISARERPRTHALNRAATGIGVVNYSALTSLVV